jgi:hypothetical protein
MAARLEKALPFRRALQTLSKAVHDHVQERIKVNVGRPPKLAVDETHGR